jgi:mRNA degradation ribonuclease J1/J2
VDHIGAASGLVLLSMYARDVERVTELVLHRIGCSGHASPEHLHEFVERVAPGVVCPIHTFEPARLYPPHAIRRVIPAYGVRYAFDGSVSPLSPVPAR